MYNIYICPTISVYVIDITAISATNIIPTVTIRFKSTKPTRHKGSRCDYTEERNSHLYGLYRKMLHDHESASFVRRCDVGGDVTVVPTPLMEQIASAPAPRYWISENRATAVVERLLKGYAIPESTTKERRRLYLHLHERFLKERELNPTLSIPALITIIVNSPAPESFVSPASIPKFIISCRDMRRRQRSEKLKDIRNENEHPRKDGFTCNSIIADDSICSHASRCGNEPWTDRVQQCRNEADISDCARQCGASDNQPVLPPVAGVPVRCASETHGGVAGDSNAHPCCDIVCKADSGVVCLQLRIDWNDDFEKQ